MPQHSAQTTSGSGNILQRRHWFPSLTFQQFQVLFNSLFKVLCIFPSRYLCTIGLPPIFSFRWNLPPTLSCNPKQLDSLRVPTQTANPRHERESHPLCCPIPRNLSLGRSRWHFYRPQFGTQKNWCRFGMNFSRFSRPY